MNVRINEPGTIYVYDLYAHTHTHTHTHTQGKRRNEWMNEWMNEQRYECVPLCGKERQRDRRENKENLRASILKTYRSGWMNEWMDEWVSSNTNVYLRVLDREIEKDRVNESAWKQLQQLTTVDLHTCTNFQAVIRMGTNKNNKNRHGIFIMIKSRMTQWSEASGKAPPTQTQHATICHYTSSMHINARQRKRSSNRWERAVFRVEQCANTGIKHVSASLDANNTIYAAFAETIVNTYMRTHGYLTAGQNAIRLTRKVLSIVFWQFPLKVTVYRFLKQIAQNLCSHWI